MTEHMISQQDNNALDRVLPFQIDGLDVRGRMVHLSDSITAIIHQHDYPDAVNRLLAEATALTALLGSSLKFEGKFIFQVQSKGPVNLLVVDFNAPDAVRAYLRFDEDRLMAQIEKGETRPEQLLGEGHLIMTIDQGQYMNRYQGVVLLDGKSLEEAAHSYFLQSEQLPTLVRLAAAEQIVPSDKKGGQSSWVAGGMMVQYLPENSSDIPHRDLHPGDHPNPEHEVDVLGDQPDAWREAEALMGTVQDHELTDPTVSAETLIYRLFHENGPRVFETMPIRHRCNCSREKIAAMFENFKPAEIEEMIVDDQVEVTCQFCGISYHFSPDEVRKN